jgi:hypothetical protein
MANSDSNLLLVDYLQSSFGSTDDIKQFSRRLNNFENLTNALFNVDHQSISTDENEIIDHFKHNENILLFVEKLIHAVHNYEHKIPQESYQLISNFKVKLFNQPFVLPLIKRAMENSALLRQSVLFPHILCSKTETQNTTITDKFLKNLQKLILRQIKSIGLLLICIARLVGFTGSESIYLCTQLSTLETLSEEYKYLWCALLTNFSPQFSMMNQRISFNESDYNEMKRLFSIKWPNATSKQPNIPTSTPIISQPPVSSLRGSIWLAWIFYVDSQLVNNGKFICENIARNEIEGNKRMWLDQHGSTSDIYHLFSQLANNDFPIFEIDLSFDYTDSDIETEFVENAFNVFLI